MADGTDGLDGLVAIVGMAGRFPGARDLGELWRNLRGGVESVRFLSRREMAALGAPAAAMDDPAWVPAVALPDGIDEFDAPFFGISHREAEILDPQHRLFLEACWTALEDAGYVPDSPPGATAVYAGATTSTYLLFNLARNPQVAASVDPLQLIVGNAVDSLTTRVSYKLNLKGASHAVQCACSTSLVAVHLACQALANQECDMALAGGVSLNVGQRAGYRFQEDSILSPDGHCRAFDAAAGGTVFGGGVGVVVLKRLADALVARDTIRAVIRGSAVNNDGAVKAGYTAPSVEGQAAVVAEALSVAGIDPETIQYIEAHGTGTALGDPIEIQALTQAFRAFTSKRGFAALGAVKSNIGHLDIASGIAGLIKTVLALEHGEIPPTLHFERPNPRIDLAASPVYVSRSLLPWPRGGEPRRAGVSSFGFGGTNAHVVLEEAPAPAARPATDRPWRLLVLSAKTEAALAAATENLAEHLRHRVEADLGDVAYTLLAGRRTFAHRRIAVCRDARDAAACLTSCDPVRTLTACEREEPRDRPLAFLFPGQGAQHVDMGRELYETEPVFREEIDRCAERLAPVLGLDLRRVLYPDEGEREEAERLLARTRLTQPALFVVEYALARLWMSWGIVPQAMIGHSIGEYVAACLSGVFTLEDALSLVAARGRLIDALPPGGMLAVALPAAELHRLLDQAGLDLAAVNEPERSVAAGPLPAIQELEARLAGRGVSCRRLHTSHAFHSRMMEPAVAPFVEWVRAARRSAPSIPFVSNVTGDFIRPEEATDPAYWGRHLRETVRFAAGVGKLLEEPDRVLLEAGPGRTLASLAARQAAGRPVIASLRHPREAGSDLAHLLTAAGRLWLVGQRLDPEKLFAGQQRRRVPLPTYPFERHRYWIAPGDALPGAVETVVTPSQTLHTRPGLATPYVPPQGELEERVAALWREVLGLAELGVHDSFLELGGDSLLATRLMARLREELAVELGLERLFERPTVAGVAAAVVEARAAAAESHELARLLAEIQELSDEGLERELAVVEGRH